MEKSFYNKKVLLYSGGMDSWLIDKLWKPDVKLFVKIGTNNNKEELKRLPKDVIIRELPLADQEFPEMNFYVPLRNLLLVELASYYGDIICLGAMNEPRANDNTLEFAQKTEDILNFLWKYRHPERNIKVVLPFVDKTKSELLQMYINAGGDIEEAFSESFSCFTPTADGKECGTCISCISKREAFAKVGYKI